MNDDFDDDGDPVTLSDADTLLIGEEIRDIDVLLTDCANGAMHDELSRQRRHLAAELAVGRRLPLPDDEEGA